MKFNKNSNLYIIIYIVVLVVVVGAALTITSTLLRPLQEANIAADKMKQILASVHIVPAKDMVKADFDKYVVEQFVVKSDGTRTPDADAFDIDIAREINKAPDSRRLPVFKVKLSENDFKYVVPVYGAGLWGPIWGYVAFNSDGSTIYGAFFSHQSETPGLGAEIAKPAFSSQFEGKTVFKNGEFLPVEVIKKGQKAKSGADYVDAVTGGTITSKGVADMLDNCLKPYDAFLSSLKSNR